MGSDTDSTAPKDQPGKPAVDTDALRARLGLGPAKAAPPSFADVPGMESSDVSGMGAEDLTPVPGVAPVAHAGAEDAETYLAGGFRLEMKPLIVATLAVILVAGSLGLILGQATSERSQLEAYDKLVAKKLQYFHDAKTASGEPMLASIQAMAAELKLATKALDRVEMEEGDLLTLEPTFEALLPKLSRYKKEQVFLDPDKVMDDVIVLYTDDVLLESVRFAVRTRHLYDHISAILGEAIATARIGTPSGASTRTVLVERYERDVPDLGKVPASRGVYIRDTGKPSLVKLMDTRGRRVTSEEWQFMVLREGNDEPVQVPTTDVISLDLKPLYEDYGKTVRRHTVSRMATLVRQAQEIASDLSWSILEKKLESPPR